MLLLGLLIAALLLAIVVILGWSFIHQRQQGRAILEVLRRRSDRPPPRPRREIGYERPPPKDPRNTSPPRC